MHHVSTAVGLCVRVSRILVEYLHQRPMGPAVNIVILLRAKRSAIASVGGLSLLASRIALTV